MDGFGFPDPFSTMVLLLALGLLPFAVLMMTSFVKIAIVLSLVRNALGVQQIPPNMALYGLALILTGYIMAPIFHNVLTALKAAPEVNLKDFIELVFRNSEPLRQFLAQNSDAYQIDFFRNTTDSLWPSEMAAAINRNSYMVLIPAFMVSELTDAFKIGFLLYLPFYAIDLTVSNILLAMGMVMVSPMTISLPLKLLLFVLVEGWTSLIQGLILTYTV